MNEPETKARQQIVEKIKASTNILVTVSKDPTVDELSAALGLTVFLNKLDKHATAIFSGAIPPAITFLNPDKVFENTADSLRDFIIALDKEKADHLRYKVEGDVVKIFITPYRTTIDENDLEFTQGDYNIELVLALGVENQEHLDVALASNSNQILHDVTIATLSAGDQASKLGSLDWRDVNASCLSEMAVDICDSLTTGKVILDKQISTALLTGIVASTERFSNPLTTSRVMALSAQLMAAGADQQLIAAKLQESHEINSLPSVSIEKIATAEPAEEKAKAPSDTLEIHHGLEEEPTAPILPEPVSSPPVTPEPEVPPTPEPASTSSSTLPPEGISPSQTVSDIYGPKISNDEEPILGGILNSTSDQAAEDARRQLDEQQNQTILKHSYLDGSTPDETAPINSSTQSEDTDIVDIFSEAPGSASTVSPQAESIVQPDKPAESSTVSPAESEPTTGLPLPPPIPDFSTLPSTAAPPKVGTPDIPSTSTLPETDPNDPSKFQIPQ